MVLLIAALVLTPTLAHAMNDGGGYGALALVAFPVLVIMLLAHLEKTHPRATGPEATSPWPSVTSPAPVVGGDR